MLSFLMAEWDLPDGLTAVLLMSSSLLCCCSPGEAAKTKTFQIGAFLHKEELRSALVLGSTKRATSQNQPEVVLRPILEGERRERGRKVIDSCNTYEVKRAVCEVLERGVFALLSTHCRHTADTLRSMARKFHMPYVTPSVAYNHTGQAYGYEIYTRPYYMQAFLDVAKHYQWQRIVYMYDSDAAVSRLDQLFMAKSEDDYALIIDLVQVASARKVHDYLVDLKTKKDTPRVVLLDLSSETSEEVFNSFGIQEMKFAKYHDRGSLRVSGFSIVDYTNGKVRSFLRRWMGLEDFWHEGAGSDFLSDEAALTADAAGVIHQALSRLLKKKITFFDKNLANDSLTVINSGTKGIIRDCNGEAVKPWELGPNIMKELRQTYYEGLTGLVRFDKYGLRRSYKLDLWTINIGKNLTKTHRGNWSPLKGLEIYQKASQYPAIKNSISTSQASDVVRVTTILSPPYLSQREKLDDGTLARGNDRYYGYCADLMAELAQNCSQLAKYELIPVHDKEYGRRLEKGTWTGMIGELIEGAADIAVAPLTITSEREQVIDFSKPFMNLGISIMIKKVDQGSPAVFSFLHPLSSEIWMCVLFGYIGVSVVLFLVSRFSPLEWHVEDGAGGPSMSNDFTICNSLWFCLGAFMQQGCDVEPRSNAGRAAGSVWWFFTLIVISSYTANLAAFLTVQRMKAPIESAQDLALQTEIKYGLVDSGSTLEFFKTSSIPLYQKMWAFMENAGQSVFVNETKRGVEKVRTSGGKYAFLVESTTNNYENQRAPCDTMKVGANLDSKGYGIGIPKGSPIRENVTLAVLRLQEEGVLHRLQEKWWHEKGECGRKDSTSKKGATNALNLENVAGMFYILMGGMLLSVVTALAEFIYKSKMEAARHKISFKSAVFAKANFSIQGRPGEPSSQEKIKERETEITAPAQVLKLEGLTTSDSSTQV